MSTDFFATLQEGARVVIRHRLAPGEQGSAGERFSDALGNVRSVTETHVVLQTRGGMVSIERALITHAKAVPPAPARRQRR
jgi:hypothetical protein